MTHEARTGQKSTVLHDCELQHYLMHVLYSLFTIIYFPFIDTRLLILQNFRPTVD